MKFSLAVCVTLLAVFVATSKADTVAIPNLDAQFKAVAEGIDQLVKKVEEVTNVKIEFDKEKFLKFFKASAENFNVELNKIVEKVKENKLIPEDAKKKIEEVAKQLQELVKGLSSPEVKEKFNKVLETIQTSVKKVSESLAELSKSYGLAIPQSIQTALSDIFNEFSHTAKVMQEKSQKILEGIQEELKKKAKA